ncbi:MAG: ABC transporter substrate-binding protein [Cyanobacteria bacterium P01_A01_bin.84]
MRISTKFPRFRSLRLPVILAVIAALTVAACNPENFRTQATQVPELVLSILSDVKTFNYALSQERPTIFPLTFEGLVTEDYTEGTGEIKGALAKSWEISEDKKQIVFTMRDNLKWSDGKPLTVDDVVFTFNDIYLNKDIPTDAKDVLRVGESKALPRVEKIDAKRVEFSTPEPFSPFLRTVGMPILPAHILKESVEKKDKDGKPKFLTTWGVDTPPEQIIVNGPYKLERYVTSQRVIFRRNPYYWRWDNGESSKDYVERIVWQIVENTDTALLQFRSGSLDSVGVSPEYFSLLKRQEKRGNYKIQNGGPNSGQTFVFFNLNQGKRNGKPLINPIKSRWFNTVEFRQAVAHAIDRERIISNTYRGLGNLQNSPISVQSPYYLSPEEGLKVYDYNLDKARQLLTKAGFKYNSRGQLLDADGNRVRFTLLTNSGNKIREAMGAQIKQDLSKIGIAVDFTPMDWGAFTDKLSNNLDWEASLLGFTGGVEPNNGANLWDPDGGLHMFNQKPQVGQKSITGRKVAPWEAEIGKLYIKAAQEFDEAKRKEIYAQTQQITQENLPLIYLVNPYSMVAVRNHIKGVNHSALGGTFWNIHEIRIEK